MLNNKEKSGLIKITLIITTLLLFFLSLTSNYALDPTQDIGGTNGLGNVPNGGTITLNPGIYNKFNDRNLELNGKNITIGALKPNTVTIDLNNSGNFINISNTSKLTLININIINGYQVDGGAINNKGGILIIENCVFTENIAYGTDGYGDGAYGGAINSQYGNLTIFNSIFTKNKASSTSIGHGHGGAINSQYGNLTIFNSIFTKNNVYGGFSARGGAIHINKGNLTIIGSSFIENTVVSGIVGYGGAIDFNDYNLTIIDSIFMKNSANDGGGAINLDNGNFTISGSIFMKNSANNNDDGVIYNDRGSLEIYSSVFYKNTGKYLIYSRYLPILEDNFYFWVDDSNNHTNPSLDDLINETINNQSWIGSYYYIELNYDTTIVGSDDFTINYIMKHSSSGSANGLTVTDINMAKNGVNYNFNYRGSDIVGFPTNVRGGSVDLLYKNEVFYTTMPFTHTKGNTSVILDSGDITDYINSNNNLVASVHDQSGKPVSDVLVYFKTTKDILLGSALTDVNGIALLSYSTKSTFDGEYYASFEGNNYFNSNKSNTKKLTIIGPTTSQITLSKDNDTYYVGDYITLSWFTNNITDTNAMGVIYFYENGVLQHSIQVHLSDRVIVYQFKKSHKSLNIVLRFSGDNTTTSSQSTISTIVYDKFIVKIVPSILTVAKRGYINITVKDLNDKPVNGGFIRLQFDNYDVFSVLVVNGVARFNKVMMKAGNKRILGISYIDKNNVTRYNINTHVRVNKGTPVMTLSLNPNTKTINNRVKITTTVGSGVIKQKYSNIPYIVRFYSGGKLAHTINKNFNASINSFVYNFKRTHKNLIITATLSDTSNYIGVIKKSSTLVVA